MVTEPWAPSRARSLTTDTPELDAVRLTFILREAGDPLQQDGVTHQLVAQSKLLALDFWVRYAEYLANELCNLYIATHDQRYIAAAEEALEGEEVDIRWTPMVRYLFGAYVWLDDALALLTSYDLVRTSPPAGPGQTNLYQLTNDGLAFSERAETEVPQLGWYAKQARLAALAAANRPGSALKSEQHQVPEYHDAATGTVIPRIREQVDARMRMLLGEVA